MTDRRKARTDQRRRYQVIMKSWKRLRELDPQQQARQRARRRYLLDELRALDLESPDEGTAWR